MSGRPTVVTSEAIERLLSFVAKGESEHPACVGAGIGYSTWKQHKRQRPELQERVAEAKSKAADLRHVREKATLEEVRLGVPARSRGN